MTTMTSKGQITIPKEFREDFDLRKGTEVFISKDVEHMGIIIRPKMSLKQVQERLTNKKLRPINIKKLLKEAREEFSKFQ